MNLTNYFKRKNYDNVDRFLLQQKFRSCRDPFEGDPFKIQSLNFRYADKPRFYPISNRSRAFATNEKPQIQNVYYNPPCYHYRFEKENRKLDNSKQPLLLKNARKSSSIYSFSTVSKPDKLASNSMPDEPSREQLFRRGSDSVGKKIDFNRSRSFIHQPVSVPFTGEPAFPNHQTALKKNALLKARNSIGTKKRSESMTAINLDHGNGCKITIKINGVLNKQVHINEKDGNCDSSQNGTESITNPAKIASPYELKPSRSYVIHKDDTVADICSEKRKSPKKLLRECSTHSMIPHREERSTLKEFRNSSSVADIIGSSSSLRLKSGSRDKRLLNSTRHNPPNVCLESLARKTPLAQRSTSGINLDRQASMLEKILSNNMIVAPSRKSFFLTKSKSVLDQRFTPLPMSGKYTFESSKSRTR